MNNPYFRELKDKIIDYSIKINLEYFKYSDVKHFVSMSDFRRLCISGFLVKYKSDKHREMSFWKINENERPILQKNLNFKR